MDSSFTPSHEEVSLILASINNDANATNIQLVPMPKYAVNDVYVIDRRYVLKTTTHRDGLKLHQEALALEEVSELGVAPRLLAHGQWLDEPNRYFILESRIEGQPLFNLWLESDDEFKLQSIQELAELITQYQKIKSTSYRIGHYQNELINWTGTWQEGHDAYLTQLLQRVGVGQHDTEVISLISAARSYYNSHRSALEPSLGMQYSHGDLHLYNVLASSQRVTGIIDWEWAGVGGVEPDFEFEALFRWALFPKAIANQDLVKKVDQKTFSLVIPTILANSPQLQQVPHLLERMTIYQIEHELHKIIKQQGTVGVILERLDSWLHRNPLADYLD